MKRSLLSICPFVIAAFLVGVLLWALQLQAEAATVLFSDDFESGADNWEPQANTCATIISDGGTQVYSVTNCGGSTARSIVTETTVPGSMSWTDYIVQARVQVVTGTASDASPMLLARYQDSRNYYFMTFRVSNGRVQIRRYYNGSSSGRTLWQSADGVISLGTWYTAALELNGNTLRAFVNGELLCTVVDTSTEAFSSGTIGVGAVNATGWWDDVNVTVAQNGLDVTKSGNGAGTVTSMPEGIDCGVTCTADFDKGTVVTLTATADLASYFAGWDGAGCSGTDPCVVTLTTAQSVTATFSTYNIFLPIALKQTSTTLRLYRTWP